MGATCTTQFARAKDQLQKINPIKRDSNDSKSLNGNKSTTNAKPKVKKAVDKITLNDEVVEVSVFNINRKKDNLSLKFFLDLKL